MIIDPSDLVAALLRLRGALLEFGITFVVAQMLVAAIGAIPGLSKRLPLWLSDSLIPPYARRVLGFSPSTSRPAAAMAAVAGLPTLLPTALLGLPYATARLVGGIMLFVLLGRLDRKSSAASGELTGRSPKREEDGPARPAAVPEPRSRHADPVPRHSALRTPHSGLSRPALGLGDGLLALLSDLFGPFLLSAILGGLVMVLVPRDVVGALAGAGRIWGPPVAAWLAYPIRAVAATELPLVSALLVAGMGPGSAVAMLIGAPVLNYDSVRSSAHLANRGGRRAVLLLVWLVASLEGLAVDLIYSR